MRRLALMLFVMLLFIPGQVLAQANVVLPAVEVDLWPEFDNPGMLVIMRISLPAGTTLPTQFTLRIPAKAGRPNAVATRQEDGSLVDATYEFNEAGSWNELVIDAATNELQIEYYDPRLEKDGNQRSFEYEWPGDYTVQSMSMQFQAPRGAYNVVLPTPFDAGQLAQDDLVYHTADIGQLQAGEQLSVDVKYQKNDDQLTVAGGTIAPDPVAETNQRLMQAIPYLLGILGVVFLAGSLIWYVRSGRGREKKSLRRSRSRHRPAVHGDASDTGPHTYCHSCGKRAAPGDRFCRTCGTPLRIDR